MAQTAINRDVIVLPTPMVLPSASPMPATTVPSTALSDKSASDTMAAVQSQPQVAQSQMAERHVPPTRTRPAQVAAATPRPTATKLPPPTPTPVKSTNVPPAFAALEQRMLELVNLDRRNAGLAPVQWDDFAAGVARAHAQEMANLGYFSHWDIRGNGPDLRYSLAGGTDASMENIYMFWWRFSDGRPAIITDWDKIVRDAQQALMSSSGHRANILMPEHTHVGIGMVYNPNTGDVRIAQTFINRYTQLSAIPRVARVGQEIDVAGFLINGASNPLINVAWEAVPRPLTVAQLAGQPHTFSPTNTVSQAIAPKVTGTQFAGKVKLDSGGRAGIYHIRIFANVNGRQSLVSDTAIQVEN